MYMTIVEWRSGHITEAVGYAIRTIREIVRLESEDVFLFTEYVNFIHNDIILIILIYLYF